MEGHIWEDNVSGKWQVYALLGYTSEIGWHDSTQADASEIRSFDDLLNPKWKEKKLACSIPAIPARHLRWQRCIAGGWNLKSGGMLYAGLPPASSSGIRLISSSQAAASLSLGAR